MGPEQALPVSPENDRTVAERADGLKPSPNNANVSAQKVESEPKREAPALAKNSWQESAEIKRIIDHLQGNDHEISISMDPTTRQVVVEIVDSRTGDTIRKLPLESNLITIDDVAKLKGLLLDAME